MTSTPPLSRKEARMVDASPGGLELSAADAQAAAGAAASAAKRARIEPIARAVAIFLMPLIIVGMMIIGYLGSMHSPSPHDMPIAVAGSASAAGSLADALESADEDAVDISVSDSVAEARDLVTRRDAVAAVVIDGDTATLYTATAAGAAQVTTVTSLIMPVLLEEGLSVVTADLAALPENDPSGLAAVFLATALVMAGYLPFSVLRSNSPEVLKFRRIVPLLAGWAALIAGIVWVVSGPILDVVTSDHYLAVLGISWLGVFAISCMQLFITRLFGPLGVIVGMFLLMVLGMPSSNMSVSMYTVPEFYRVLHEFLPMGAIGESMRAVLYFGGVGLTQHLLVLAVGAVAGLFATAAYDALRGHRYRDGVATDVNIPSLHGGRRPKRSFWRYVSLLFFPLAMVTMMITCMLGAMHQPTPRDMPIAVVGTTVDQAEDTIAGLEKTMEGMFDFTAYSSADTEEITALVDDRALVAAFVLPSQDSPEFTLIANQAGSPSAYQVAVRVFTQIAESQNTPIDVDDTTPLPERDSNGVVTMYLAMGWILAGFMVVIVGANAAPATRPLKKMLPITVGYAIFMSAVVWLIGAPITGSIAGHFFAMWGSGALAIFSIAMFAMVFERLFGMFSIIPVMGVLMFLGVPSSNAAFSVYMAPEWFRTLHDFLPMPAAVETIRSILYFDGDVVAQHLQVLALWGLVSLALVFVIDALKPVRTEHDFGDLGSTEPDRAPASRGVDAEAVKTAAPGVGNHPDEDALYDEQLVRIGG